MKIEVIYALASEQKSFFVETTDKITVRQAIEKSKILETYLDLNIESIKVGVYGEIVNLDDYVQDRDRIEIYRDLTIDPKKARMLRAEQKRKKQGGKPFSA